MFDVVLFEPEIPPNTGNIIRLCANMGAQLHLIHPLGFKLEDSKLRRAGLDYLEWTGIKEYSNWEDFLKKMNSARLFACSTKGGQRYCDVHYQKNDVFLFGPESRGLPSLILNQIPDGKRIRIPMLPKSRSLNLSNAVAVILYEAWRQLDFCSHR